MSLSSFVFSLECIPVDESTFRSGWDFQAQLSVEMVSGKVVWGLCIGREIITWGWDEQRASGDSEWLTQPIFCSQVDGVAEQTYQDSLWVMEREKGKV